MALRGAGAGDDDHVPGRGIRGAADGKDRVLPVVAPEELGPLEGICLGYCQPE